MALSLLDNISYTGSKPDFVRQEYESFAKMKAVKDFRMPELYIAYCLEDRNYYKYDKANSIDPILGKFRLFKSGDGSSDQVTEMPEPSEAYLDKVVQYIGESTIDFTKGYFYICEQVTEDEKVTTLSELTQLINSSDSIITFQPEIGASVNLNAYAYSDKAAVIYDDTVYLGTVSDNTIYQHNSIVISNDTDVRIANIIKPVYVYKWINLSVTPSSSEPESISMSDIDKLFE